MQSFLIIFLYISYLYVPFHPQSNLSLAMFMISPKLILVACVTFSLILTLEHYLKVEILNLFGLYLNTSFMLLCPCLPAKFL